MIKSGFVQFQISPFFPYLVDVEVVLEELVCGGRRLPVELGGDLAPELGRLLHRLLQRFHVIKLR